MGYLVFMTCLILECCPIDKWTWDFGFYWLVIYFILIVQIALDVTKAQGKADRSEE